MPDPPRPARLETMRAADVSLWRGCILANGYCVTGLGDYHGAPTVQVDAYAEEDDLAELVYRDGVWRWRMEPCGAWETGPVEGVFPDPDAPANWGHLDRMLAERHGILAWRGVEYEPWYGTLDDGWWGIQGWRLRGQPVTELGRPCAWLGHGEIPATPDRIRDLRVLALREAHVPHPT